MLTGACALLLLHAQSASAHDGSLDLTASFEQGFLHPITGVDHLIAMVAVGLLSGVLGGRAVVTVPALFVTFLLIGGAFGFYAIELVGVELWILGSLLLLGLVLAATVRPSRSLVFVAIALFGFAHGNAHGLELPLASSALGYAAGFAIASAMCHASGILVALGASRTPRGRGPIRVLGLATFGAAVYMSSSMLTG
ncbi:MAG TPA: HupE/UreJ family protein [Solirubrobacteraceae bacterium]